MSRIERTLQKPPENEKIFHVASLRQKIDRLAAHFSRERSPFAKELGVSKFHPAFALDQVSLAVQALFQENGRTWEITPEIQKRVYDQILKHSTSIFESVAGEENLLAFFHLTYTVEHDGDNIDWHHPSDGRLMRAMLLNSDKYADGSLTEADKKRYILENRQTLAIMDVLQPIIQAIPHVVLHEIAQEQQQFVTELAQLGWTPLQNIPKEIMHDVQEHAQNESSDLSVKPFVFVGPQVLAAYPQNKEVYPANLAFIHSYRVAVAYFPDRTQKEYVLMDQLFDSFSHDEVAEMLLTLTQVFGAEIPQAFVGELNRIADQPDILFGQIAAFFQRHANEESLMSIVIPIPAGSDILDIFSPSRQGENGQNTLGSDTEIYLAQLLELSGPVGQKHLPELLIRHQEGLKKIQAIQTIVKGGSELYTKYLLDTWFRLMKDEISIERAEAVILIMSEIIIRAMLTKQVLDVNGMQSAYERLFTAPIDEDVSSSVFVEKMMGERVTAFTGLLSTMPDIVRSLSSITQCVVFAPAGLARLGKIGLIDGKVFQIPTISEWVRQKSAEGMKFNDCGTCPICKHVGYFEGPVGLVCANPDCRHMVRSEGKKGKEHNHEEQNHAENTGMPETEPQVQNRDYDSTQMSDEGPTDLSSILCGFLMPSRN
jgi:hypothetical protein